MTESWSVVELTGLLLMITATLGTKGVIQYEIFDLDWGNFKIIFIIVHTYF